MIDQLVLANNIYTDFDHFNSHARNWELDFVLTSNHGFKIEYYLSQINNCMLNYVHFNCKLHQFGQSPKNMRTFVIPVNDQVNYYWRNHEIKGNTLQLFPANGELFCISNETFKCYVVSFPSYLFNEMLFQVGIDYRLGHYDKELVWQVNTETIKKLRHIAMCYKNAIVDPENLLLKTIVESLPSKDNRIEEINSENNDIVDACLDFFSSNIIDSIYMKDLVKLTGKSERTIQYKFKQKFGVTPFEYLKSVKLLNAYKDIIDNPGLTIAEIAYRNGFSHLGQFGVDFKRKFGFSPSRKKLTKKFFMVNSELVK